MKKRHIFGIILIVLLFVAAFIGILLYAKLNLINRVDLGNKVQISDLFKKDTVVEPGDDDKDEEETGEAEDESPLSGFEIIALVGLDTRTASEYANSDTMIFACLNHDDHSMRLFSLYRDTLMNIGGDRYRKANAAYCNGGPEQFLSMVNLNLDLNVTKFVTTNFNALAKVIDILGGLDIDMTREELIHMNNYNVETSEVCGVPYKAVEVPDDVSFDGYRTRTFHLTGTQAVSYARIRYTQGWDYKRTERQRLVLQKLKEKSKTVTLSKLFQICNEVFPLITTNLSNEEIFSLVRYCMSYDILGECGFPFEKSGLDVDGMDCVVPTTLAENAIGLHEFIFPGVPYTPSATVQGYSDIIKAKADGSYASAFIPDKEDEIVDIEKIQKKEEDEKEKEEEDETNNNSTVDEEIEDGNSDSEDPEASDPADNTDSNDTGNENDGETVTDPDSSSEGIEAYTIAEF